MNNRLIALTSKAIATVALAATIGGALRCAAAPLAGDVVPGEERHWKLAFRTGLEPSAGARPVEVALTGDWIAAVSAVRADEYDVMLQMANVQLSGEGGAPAGEIEQFRSRLERPFWATYHADGSLSRLYFYKDSDPGDRNLLQMIAVECQFVTGTNPQSWQATERDGSGQYNAVYRRAGNVVTKQRLGYVNAPGGLRISIDSSETRFTMDRDGEIASIDGSSRVRLEAALGNSGALTAITEVHLSAFRKEQAPRAIGSLAQTLPDLAGSPIETHKQDPEVTRARMDRQLLEGRTTESVLRAALSGNPADPQADDRMAALFRQRPEASATAVELLRKGGPVKKITDALGSAGSPAAIEALGAIARDRSLSRPLRIDALTALMLNQRPAAEALRVAASLLTGGDAAVASAARIAGGALARAGRADHADEATAIDTALLSLYRRSHDTKERCDLLAALGNSAGSKVAPAIEEALRDPEDVVRSAAASALRLVSGPEADGLLAEAIARDRDAEVRASAVFAAGFRRPMSPQLVEALTHAAKADSAEHVRVAAIGLLRQNAQSVPDLAGILAWVAAHDEKPAVRRLAQDGLKK